MENLSKIAQGLFFGNSEVWNFLDYAVNRKIGGLLSYTKQNNYLTSNLTDNFNGGKSARYKYADIKMENPLSVSHARGVNIGEVFTVKESLNSNLKFKTSEENAFFAESCRNLHENYSTYFYRRSEDGQNDSINYVETVREQYNIDDSYRKLDNITSLKWGDSMGYTDILRKTEIPYNIEKVGELLREKTEYFTVPNTIRDIKDRFYKEGEDKEINNIGDGYEGYKERYEAITSDRLKNIKHRTLEDESWAQYKNIEKIRKKHLSFNDNPEEVIKDTINSFKNTIFNGTTSNEVERYIVPLEETINSINPSFYVENYSEVISIMSGNLYKFHEKTREKYASPLNDIIYPQFLGNKVLWTKSTPYAINAKTDEDVYIVGQSSGYSISTIDKNYASANLRNAYYAEGGVAETDSNTFGGNSSRLLQYTNQLFKEQKADTLIRRFGISKDGETISRGRALLSEGGKEKDGFKNQFCRAWTAHYQYSQINHLIRPIKDKNGNVLSLNDVQNGYDELRPNGMSLGENTVLRSNGFIRVTPTHYNGSIGNGAGNIKKYMFSIENLAWKDTNSCLTEEQKGPNKGRIMWFPPYNLKFSENIKVDWNSHNFIGRGESIYTYSNTHRSGTLDFTLLIDHPSILNKWRGTGSDISDKNAAEQKLLRFFAGEGLLDKELSGSNTSTEGQMTDKKNKKPCSDTRDFIYIVFFPPFYSGQDEIIENRHRDVVEELENYNNGIGFTYLTDSDFSLTKEPKMSAYNLKDVKPITCSDEEIKEIAKKMLGDKSEKSVIKRFKDLKNISKEFTEDTIFGCPKQECEISKIKVVASVASDKNIKEAKIKTLGPKRSQTGKTLLLSFSKYLHSGNFEVKRGSCVIPADDYIDGGNVMDINAINTQMYRAIAITITVKYKNGVPPSIEEGEVRESNEKGTKEGGNTSLATSTRTVGKSAYTYDNEYLYFSEVRGEKILYNNIIDKVKYFDPAFHSITPEGFNARLTFLHQCTRQGPTNSVSSVGTEGNNYTKYAGNLAFGRAPYCVLRIGDFFNTKICIDSISIQYDNNGIQWDLNPEGIGVQPMFANISISFSFIGGQDLSGPIERLQNAVTSNFYANASVYSRHADSSGKIFDARKG